ncbi:MAG: OmpA family protein, partial [Ignavibacteriaceae bacterium]|nr:OmpA family protein [Ignavibacteriaceae bacterium]
MKRFILILLTIVIATAIPTTAQFDHWGSKIGLRANLLFPENEYPNLGMLGNDDFSFDWFKLSYLGEVFYAIELSRAFELQLNAGYGSYAGAAYSKDPFNDRGEYKTTIIPIHLRIKLSPFNTTTWNPFLYAGGGVINYSVKTKPIISGGKLTELEGWAAFVPGGIGAEFTLSDNVFLELTAGGAVASTYGLDAFKTSNDAQWDAYLNFGVGISAAGESCSSDDDGDGLGKCDEEKYGTDADDPDTDNDGLSDGEEILNSKSNPLELDSDMDGLSDYDEVIKIKSNPLNADTDADGLTDSKEVFEHKTNPCEPDSDFDGLNDNEEISKYGTNPSKDDTDGEGLKDGDEVLKYKTDPFNNDTDSDGLFDGEEVM